MYTEVQVTGQECERVENLFHDRTLDTRVGKIYLRNDCPATFVESLQIDSGLRAFARLAEREHQLLIDIARRSDARLALAYTPAGCIVGEVTVAPANAWWSGLEKVYEGAIEVSSNWRRLGLARQLLAFALEHHELEDIILLALGFSWHWDTEGLGLERFSYRELIARLFATQGFVEYLTSEPNIRMDPANIFLARIGSRVDQQHVNQFLNRLLTSPTLPGL